MLQVIIANHTNSKKKFLFDEVDVCILTIFKRIFKYDSIYTSSDDETPPTKKEKG